MERSLQLGVRHVGLFEPKSRRSDIPLELGRLSSEVITDEADLVHNTLPHLLCTETTKILKRMQDAAAVCWFLFKTFCWVCLTDLTYSSSCRF